MTPNLVSKHAVSLIHLGSLYKTMVSNLLDPIVHSNCKIIRINIIFGKSLDLDTLIGRAAHIRMLDNPTFVEMFVALYRKYFE